MSLPSVSQRIITNSAGERVVIYPDGTWRNAEPGDSLLLRNTAFTPEELPANAMKAMNKAERYEFLVRQWTDLYTVINIEKIEVQKLFRDATNTKFRASEELQSAENNKKLIEPDRLADLEDAYDEAVESLRNAKKQQNSIKKITEKADKVNSLLSKLKESKVNAVRNQYNRYIKTYTPKNSFVASTKKSAKSSQHENSNQWATNSTSLQMSPEMVNRKPDYTASRTYTSKPDDCSVKVEQIDQDGGIVKLETAPGLLFTFTEPELRPYFKDKDLMQCRGRLTQVDKYICLTVEFQIASSHSQSNFGALQEGSLLRFLLMNEETVLLYNLKTNHGRIDPYSGHTIFTGQYAIGKKEIKALKRASLDKMRVMWSTGFEDYEVIHLDFMMDQIDCLEKGSKP